MIDLKRNKRGELVPASGKRSRKSSIYNPNQKSDFKISRGKFSDFLDCKRCFYLDRVRGLDVPGQPSWTLNEATDFLLKKEFDACRESQIPHRLFLRYGLHHLVPFKHDEMDRWRDSLHHGLMTRFGDTNIILTGGVDDIWKNIHTGKLVVLDYKSQANTKSLDPDSYLSDVYKQGYKIQLDFYAYLLLTMGFEVEETGYFLVCNANRGAVAFEGALKFEEVLIPYKWSVDWIPAQVKAMIDCMNNEIVPESNPSCKNCAYMKEAFSETQIHN